VSHSRGEIPGVTSIAGGAEAEAVFVGSGRTDEVSRERTSNGVDGSCERLIASRCFELKCGATPHSSCAPTASMAVGATRRRRMQKIRARRMARMQIPPTAPPIAAVWVEVQVCARDGGVVGVVLLEDINEYVEICVMEDPWDEELLRITLE
jgi:hypothetical protein